ncbi:MAG: hypothetical protein ACK4SN_16095, partial [Bellilinea sp.]
ATFSEAVQNVTPDDFSVVESGDLSGSQILSVSSMGNTCAITIQVGSGVGRLGLKIKTDTLIRDLAGNLLEGLPYEDAAQDYLISVRYPLFLPLVKK